jgi:hypothetical protein
VASGGGGGGADDCARGSSVKMQSNVATFEHVLSTKYYGYADRSGDGGRNDRVDQPVRTAC